VIQLTGHTYHNQDARDPDNVGEEYIRRHFLAHLMNQPISLPDKDGKIVRFMPKDLGIGYPVLVAVE